jgi:hypothetical protein
LSDQAPLEIDGRFRDRGWSGGGDLTTTRPRAAGPPVRQVWNLRRDEITTSALPVRNNKIVGRHSPAVGRDVAPGHRVVWLRQDDGMHADSASKIRNRRVRFAGQHLTRNQMFGSRRQPARTRGRRFSLIYITWYINSYGSPWTPLDVNPRIRPVHEQMQVLKGCYASSVKLSPPQ